MEAQKDTTSQPRWAAVPAATRRIVWLTASAFAFSVIILVMAVAFVAQQVETTREARLDVNRTRDMLHQLQLVLSTLQDAETGERGYIITGAPEFLEPYERARQTLDSQLERLGALVDDADARATYEHLRREAREQMAYYGSVIALRRQQGEEAAGSLINARVGKERMDRIRGLIEALRATDERLLAGRAADVSAGSRRSELLMYAGVGSAVLFSCIAGLFLLRHLRARLQAEQAATRAYTVLRATLDNINQGICVWDAQCRLAAWNDRFAELRGIPPNALHAGMSPDEVASLADPYDERNMTSKGSGRTAGEVIRARQPFDVEVTRTNGLVLQLGGRPMQDGYFILTVSDVTAIRVSEANYRDQATRLASTLDNIVDAIITINESGSIESWSKGAERLLGYTAEEVLRRNVSLLMPEPHASAHDSYLRRYIATGERRIIGTRRELEALHKDGRRIPVDLGISEMRIGKRRLFIGVLRDISDRREIERLKSGFVSTVSHELRTPLTSISGSLGLIAGGVAGELSPKAKRLIDIAHVNSARLVRLINDILDLEKAESGRLEFRLEPQNLRSIVEQVIDDMRGFASQYRVQLVMIPGAWDVQVFVDRDRLIQVFTNLVSNACKFSPAGSNVELSVRREAENVQILVRDYGPGIPREFRPRMFQRFAQADSSDSRAKGGTGLGLSIAKTMIERLGGSIYFETEEGQGTTFYVSLPRHNAVSSAEAIDQDPATSGSRILVCEDDPDVAVVLCDVLRQAGMRAESVGSARAAKAALINLDYDLAIVDLHLPDMAGIDLIAELREEPATRSLPVIVISAAAATSNEAESLQVLHLADWLQKPIDPQRLLRSIQAALSVKQRGRARVLHIEDDVPLTMLVRELLSDDVDVSAAHSVAEAQQLLQEQSFDLVILDVGLADGSGLEVLGRLGQPDTGMPPVILYSATEPSREISQLVQGSLVKSRDSVDLLLRSVRELTRGRDREIVMDMTRAEKRSETR